MSLPPISMTVDQLQEYNRTGCFPREGKPAAQVRENRAYYSKSYTSGVISFVVPGEPIGAPRMTQSDVWKRRPCVVRYRDWKDRARLNAGPLPAAEDINSLSWVAVFSPPAKWSKKKRAESIGQQHRIRPDRDNIDKAILDALFPGGDQAIAAGTLRKEWGVIEGLYVTIEVNDER